MFFKDTFFSKKLTLNLSGKLHKLSTPLVMGILNITPDSFYSGSRINEPEKLVHTAKTMHEEGAWALDVGACSSRPGAEDISQKEELERLLPALGILRDKFPDAILSADTFRSGVARKAVEEYRVDLVNDISAGELDPEMFPAIAELNVPYVAMHLKGNPRNMAQQVQYDDLMKEILMYFAEKTNQLRHLGVKDIIVDPGFGFAKTVEQNYFILSHLEQMRILELPLMVGLSRKSMIWKTLESSPEEALNGTTVLHTIALMKGADILRVHDVREATECIKLIRKFREASSDEE